MEKGKQEGIKEGLEKGLAEGKYEKAIETAKSMLSNNLPIDVIAKYTGLFIEEIKSLK